MSIIRRAAAELRAGIAQFGDSSIPPNSSVNGAGGMMNEAGALSIMTVLQCAKVLANDVSILPFSAFTGDRLGVKRLIPTQPLIVTQPFGPDLGFKAGIRQVVLSLVLRGNCYLWVLTRDSRGNPTTLLILHPDRVTPGIDKDTGRKTFRVGGQLVDPSNMIHILGALSLPGMNVGLDPLTYMRATLALAADRQAYGGAYFRNGTSPAGVITVPGPGDRKKARDVKEAFEAGHAGVANSHRPAVLFGGATWTQLSVTPENAQFLGTGQFLREEICGWFGVPLQRVMATPNGSPAAGKGLDTIDQGYATHTLLPITVTIEDVWDAMVAGGAGTWTHFDFAGLLRANAMERAQIAQIHRLTGVRNRDEIRADEGWEPIGEPDGTDYNVPFNTNSAVPPLIDPGQAPAIAPAVPTVET